MTLLYTHQLLKYFFPEWFEYWTDAEIAKQLEGVESLDFLGRDLRVEYQ